MVRKPYRTRRPSPATEPVSAAAAAAAQNYLEVEKVQPPPPPDAGLVAWLQVTGAFFLVFNSWGLVNTWGVFQDYLETTLLPTHSSSTISWIGTTQGFLLFILSVIVGPIFDRGFLKSLIATGTVLVVFGLLMASLATQYYQLFLAQGLTTGIGFACLFLPSVATVATYFSSRRALATGITTAGGSIGSVIYPILFSKLIGPLGFGWTTRIIAFVALATLTLSLTLMKLRLPPPQHARALFDISALREPSFLLYSIGLFFAMTGLYIPIFEIQVFFADYLKASPNISFYILSILNATSVFGRVTPGILADRIGSINTFVPMALINAVLALSWLGINNVPGAIVFACIYGYTSGAIVSLMPTMVASLTPRLDMIGTRMGMTFGFSGFGLLIGNPIAGALLNLRDGIFWRAQLFCGLCLVAGTFCFVALRLREGARRDKWKM